MTRDLLFFLVMINPFAQVVYLAELMRESSRGDFRKIYALASVFSLVIMVLFALTGEMILTDVFRVSISAMSIFGGLIILSVAYAYIAKGPSATRLFEGDITDIAQQITLPFIIGPGTLWLSIKAGQDHGIAMGPIVPAIALAANFFVVMVFHVIYKSAKGRVEIAMRKYLAMLMRLNALMIGAVAVEMILNGLRTYITNAIDKHEALEGVLTSLLVSAGF